MTIKEFYATLDRTRVDAEANGHRSVRAAVINGRMPVMGVRIDQDGDLVLDDLYPEEWLAERAAERTEVA